MSEPWAGTPFEAEYHRLHDEIDRLRAVLQRVEWVDTSGGEYLEECPICEARGPYRDPACLFDEGKIPRPTYTAEHEPGCPLAAALR